MRINRWTDMDSAITNAEHDIIYGAQEQQDLRDKGELETLSGYNYHTDPMVTKMYLPGDPAMDDNFLKHVFHNHFTYAQSKEDPKQKTDEKVLRQDQAWLASLEIVKTWNHLDEAKAESFLNKNF